jgi:hypothetical protein
MEAIKLICGNETKQITDMKGVVKFKLAVITSAGGKIY